MMSHDEWLSALVKHARQIASREYQERTWFRKDLPVEVNWVVEAYEVLDDLTFDLFFEMYSKEFTASQVSAWVGSSTSRRNMTKRCPRTLMFARSSMTQVGSASVKQQGGSWTLLSRSIRRHQ